MNDPETEKNILEQILTEEKQKKDALVSSVEMTDAAKDETAATADQTVAVHTEVVSKVEKEMGDKVLRFKGNIGIKYCLSILKDFSHCFHLTLQLSIFLTII